MRADPEIPGLSLLGVDFTSAPSRRKPITVAQGRCIGHVIRLERLLDCPSFESFESLLSQPGPWLGAFDFPFGLPREFVETLALGRSALEVIETLHKTCGARMGFRALIDGWGRDRAAGHRLPHRKTDGAVPGVTSTSPLQTRYVPVGFMYFEGLARLIRSGLSIPGMHAGDPARTALEGYPGLLAHELVGRRSYKNRDAPDRLIARKDIVEALEQGRTRLELRLKISNAQRESLVDDPSGDHLDAVLCLVQAAWASGRPGCGLPVGFDAVEGWIATA